MYNIRIDDDEVNACENTVTEHVRREQWVPSQGAAQQTGKGLQESMAHRARVLVKTHTEEMAREKSKTRFNDSQRNQGGHIGKRERDQNT